MRSSEGLYFPALDHVRALAAFLVFNWHVINTFLPHPAPALFPFSVFNQGHCGVALFMVLSGYLFALLLSRKDIKLSAFYYNRIIRLFPLLIVILCVYALAEPGHGRSIKDYFLDLPRGFILPTWKGGAWSIATELHFYLLLPILLWLKRRSPALLLGILALALVTRALVWMQTGDVQDLAYLTIFGRIDQFVLGMLAAEYAAFFKGRTVLAAVTAIAFCAFYAVFDHLGGYSFLPKEYNAIWIIVPTIEGLCFAVLIAWYDRSFRFKHGLISRAVALVGTVSYSIYLLHPLMVNVIMKLWSKTGFVVHTPEQAMLLALPMFLSVVPVAWLSFIIIEKPFLRLRKRYTKPAPGAQAVSIG